MKRAVTINKGMVLIKVAYSTAYLGLIILVPYLTLQALTLGLTYEDISIIYGITPAITFMMSPISGKNRHKDTACLLIKLVSPKRKS